MKRKNLFRLAVSLLPALLLFSCKKDDPVATPDNTGTLVVNSISINNFTPTDSTTLTGVSHILYLVPGGSGTDTVALTDTFTFSTLSGFTKSYNLQGPAQATGLDFSMEVIIGKGGTATSVTAGNITINYNGKNYLDAPLPFTGTSNYFVTPTQSVTF